ncbi:hypothetical protein SteCoe_16 [Stentor coeruleus]|uniref:Nas2 N-terminal domain-containing protein n=1 Tax=Stentor coeruleus TaxID=5963 RepID=A0A1R2D506_9CILI|nr:hypothetical protein SteCoe_16 [Stentor coeruleus]
MSREQVLRYSDDRDKIEKEIVSLVEYLTAPGMPGLKGSLVDAEGFPLAGVDLYQVRQARQKYAMLNNDYTALMQKIESELHAFFGNPENRLSRPEVRIPVQIEIGTSDSPISFAEITEVAPESPAFNAGFIISDRIVSFGPINFSNHNNLSGLVNYVKDNEGKSIRVLVLRAPDNRQVTLNIIPQKWTGAGIMGCRFKPIN